MKTTLAIILALVMLAGMIPQMALRACAAPAQTASWDTDGDGVLSILAIGNSFSVDALEYAYQIARDLGIEKIVIGNLYIGGCSLATHITNAKGDLGKYTYYYNDSGTWSSTANYKISTALASRSWDYISLQQASNYSGVESTYGEDLTDLIAYVQARSNAKLVWHMTWAYQQNSTHSAFPTYGSDQMTMYNAIVNAVRNKIVTNGNIDLIVPNGTAVQNSRTSLLGDTTTRDGYHMSYTYGRYLTGLLFVKTVTGLSLDAVQYRPSGVSQLQQQIALESVNNAAAVPFAVSQSAFTGEAPEDGYIQLKPELTKGGYWHPINAEKYNQVVTDASNSKYFFATPRFTREDIPVGSIIILESGWQYRPDGWVTDTVQSSRADTTTQAYTVVTEEWWGEYTLRGFNIAKVGTPSLMDLDAEDIHKAFRIYVPEELHSHAYSAAVTAPSCTENGCRVHTCMLCGHSYTELIEALGHSFGNGSCTVCGEADPDYTEPEPKNGICAGGDGNFYLYRDNVIQESFTGLYDNGVANWYITKGQVLLSYNGLVTADGQRYYIKGGCVNDFTGLKKLDGTWLYLVSGKVETGYAGLVEHSGLLVYVENGEVDFNKKDVVAYSDGKLYYVKYGIVSPGFTGMVKGSDGVWRYIKNGAFDDTYAGLAKNAVGWWYVENGLIDTTFTGVVTYAGADYYVKWGQVMLNDTEN